MIGHVLKGAAMGAAAGLITFMALGGTAPASTRPVLVAAPASPAAQRPLALAAVEPGLWTVTSAEAGALPRRLCLDDPIRLAQLQHGDADCHRLLVADQPHDATVEYRCAAGAGFGRTSLRVSDGGRVRIDTQGIAGNAPFAFRAEARRDGSCRR